jgi:type II secretory pathway component PulJ
VRNAHGKEGEGLVHPPARSFKRGGVGVNLAALLARLAAAGLHAYSKAMSSERAIEAMERIERAIARVEAAASTARPASHDDGELQQLRETHRALRGQVEGAIAQIDRLLANGGGM